MEEGTLAEADQHCDRQNSMLPDLSSVKNETLLSYLQSGESTWIDAVIQRGPWTWHTTGNLNS